MLVILVICAARTDGVEMVSTGKTSRGGRGAGRAGLQEAGGALPAAPVTICVVAGMSVVAFVVLPESHGCSRLKAGATSNIRS
eukprot:2280790-Prymnesium_polylepis.1